MAGGETYLLEKNRQPMETVTCNLCHSAESDPLYCLPDLLLGRSEVQTTLVKCRQCGLVYQNPRPTLEEIGAHYPPEYESYDPEPAGRNASWLMEKAIAYGIQKRCRFVTRHKAAGRLLDIGCASGVFLRGMQRQPGWRVQGVEVSPYAAQIAREQYGLEVFTGTLEEADFPEDTFDAVTLWDVLEHLHNPAASLDTIQRILKPDGILVFRVPHGGSPDARLFGRYWAGLDAPRHLYVFDEPSLRRLLAQAGFAVRSLSSRSGSYPTFVLSVRFWMAARGWSAAAQQRGARLLTHPFARLLSAPLFFLTSQTVGGPLLTVTAEKAPKSD